MITGIGDHLRPEWPITITGMRKHAPKARDFTNRRYRHHGVVDEIERAKNRIKSIRARVEHSIGVIKRVFGFAKVRYRGLNKNAHRLLVTCALRRAQA
jgi:IS5 family transposase